MYRCLHDCVGLRYVMITTRYFALTLSEWNENYISTVNCSKFFKCLCTLLLFCIERWNKDDYINSINTVGWTLETIFTAQCHAVGPRPLFLLCYWIDPDWDWGSLEILQSSWCTGFPKRTYFFLNFKLCVCRTPVTLDCHRELPLNVRVRSPQLNVTHWRSSA